MAEFLQNEDEVDHGQKRGGKMVIAEEVDQGHQSDEGIDLCQGHHPHESTEDHHPQGEDDQGHHHLDALEDHAQSLPQTRGNPIRTLKKQKIKVKLMELQMVRRFIMKMKKP